MLDIIERAYREAWHRLDIALMPLADLAALRDRLDDIVIGLPVGDRYFDLFWGFRKEARAEFMERLDEQGGA